MSMYEARIFNASGGVCKDFEMWSLYAAFTRPDPDTTMVKVGISTRPMQRLYTIHVNSPFAVEAAIWTSAGDASTVRKLERAAHLAFASRRTRGEWFRFDLTDPAEKRDFHDSLNKVYLVQFGRMPKWKKTGLAQIIQCSKLGGSLLPRKQSA